MQGNWFRDRCMNPWNEIAIFVHLKLYTRAYTFFWNIVQINPFKTKIRLHGKGNIMTHWAREEGFSRWFSLFFRSHTLMFSLISSFWEKIATYCIIINENKLQKKQGWWDNGVCRHSPAVVGHFTKHSILMSSSCLKSFRDALFSWG